MCKKHVNTAFKKLLQKLNEFLKILSLLHKQTPQKLWIYFIGNKQKTLHTAEVQPTILQLRKTSISKPATQLAYWLQESHKPFCLLVLLISDARNPLAPFTYIVFPVPVW